jgi:hypothetical protein
MKRAHKCSWLPATEREGCGVRCATRREGIEKKKGKQKRGNALARKKSMSHGTRHQRRARKTPSLLTQGEATAVFNGKMARERERKEEEEKKERTTFLLEKRAALSLGKIST